MTEFVMLDGIRDLLPQQTKTVVRQQTVNANVPQQSFRVVVPQLVGADLKNFKEVLHDNGVDGLAIGLLFESPHLDVWEYFPQHEDQVRYLNGHDIVKF